MKIVIEAEVQKVLIRLFLQHIRDFDVRYPDDVHFSISVDARGEGISKEELLDIMRSIDPPFRFETYTPIQ